MPDLKISQLPAASALAGTEDLPVVQSMEDLRAEALALATRMCDLTGILTSPGFRGAVDLEEVHALTEQLHAISTAHFYVLRRIALAERK